MKEYQIITDGSCDLSDSYVEQNHICVIPFYVEVESNIYKKEKEELNVREFYQTMVDNSEYFPRTSLPSIQDYYQVFEKSIQDGKDILCITITRKFSGSFNSASNAKELILEEYPDAHIEVIDSIVNTVCQGLIVKEFVRMKELGKTMEEAIALFESKKRHSRIFFTTNGLEYLAHGGRVGKVTAAIGSVLKVTPLIVLKEGEVASNGIALNRKRAFMKIREHTLRYLERHHLKIENMRFVVGYGYDIEEAKDFKAKLANALSIPDEQIELEQIGATIAVHTGPYPLGIACVEKFDS